MARAAERLHGSALEAIVESIIEGGVLSLVTGVGVVVCVDRMAGDSAVIASAIVAASSSSDPLRVFSAERPNPGSSNAATRKREASSAWAGETCRPPPPCR